MKRNFLIFLLITSFITCSAGMLWATPVLNDNGSDGFEDIAGSPYAYYVNSGGFMFLGSKYSLNNDLGNAANLLAVQNAVINWLNDNTTYDTTDFILVNTTSGITVQYYNKITGVLEDSIDEDNSLSGIYTVNSGSQGIEFYAIKSQNDFAMYFEQPPETAGSWSTYDLLATHSGSDLSISHFTGYNGAGASAPEPATMLLLGTGLLGLAGFGRKKLKK